ncbi:putative oxidoreductase UxuB [subsurface metagenome]
MPLSGIFALNLLREKVKEIDLFHGKSSDKALGKVLTVECNVLNKKNVDRALENTLKRFGTVDILINGAGGSKKEATTSPELEFFDIDPGSLNDVMKLNYLSAVIPSQAVGRIFAKRKSGVILNISSIAGIQPLTRAIAYSNGKAATNNFTQWLAVHMAKNFSSKIRVNAIAPGFILTEQNRFLLIDEKTQKFTERGKQIINFVPMKRLGNPNEIVGAALWLVSDSATFVTGAVVPVDGGFTAFSGV